MGAPARSARRPFATRRLGRLCGRTLGRRCRFQLLLLRPDRPQPLMEPGPRPRLELLVAHLQLTACGFEVLEPGIRLLDQQELVRVAVARHADHLPRRMQGRMRGTIGPGPDDTAATGSAGSPGTLVNMFFTETTSAATCAYGQPRALERISFAVQMVSPAEAGAGAGAWRGRRSSRRST